MYAAKTIVVSASAHDQIDLLYSMIGSDVEGLVLLGDLHRLDRLTRCHVENVQQDGLRVAVIVDPLDNFVHASVACNTREQTRLPTGSGHFTRDIEFVSREHRCRRSGNFHATRALSCGPSVAYDSGRKSRFHWAKRNGRSKRDGHGTGVIL